MSSESWGCDCVSSYGRESISETSSISWGSYSRSSISGSQVVSSSSSNGWGIYWSNSSVWVRYQTSSSCGKSIGKRASISSICNCGCSSNWSNSWSCSNSMSKSRYSWGGYKGWGVSSIDGTFGSQVVGSGCSYRWCVNWSYCSIWVTYKTMKACWCNISKRSSIWTYKTVVSNKTVVSTIDAMSVMTMEGQDGTRGYGKTSRNDTQKLHVDYLVYD